MLDPCAVLLGAGHAMHLGLTEAVDPARLTALWDAWPGLSIGHAVPRRDRWRRLAETLGPPLTRGLPPDPGILAYLRQLDLDLVLLGEAARAGSIEAEYLRACQGLGLGAAVIGGTAEAVLAQAGHGAVAAPVPEGLAGLYRPALWAALAFDDLTHPPAPGPAGEDREGGSDDGLWRRMQEAYARRVYPALAATTVALAPGRRPLLRAGLGERLDPGMVANEISAERVMAQAAEGRGLVVLGPWWDDPDLELLYWTPFLRWWRRRYQVDKERIVVVSSGGARPWYDGLVGQYFDLTELYEPAALADLDRSRTQELAQRRKRFGVTDADRQIVKRLDRRLGFRGLKVLPAWAMAVSFERYWSGHAGPALLGARTRPQAIRIKEKRARQRVPGLPSAYLAVGLPDDCGGAFQALIRRVADKTRVVVLSEPAHAGGAAALAASAQGVQIVGLEARTAKETASAVLAAACGYLGPQGWMAHAAAALGRPTICLGAGQDERQRVDAATAARLFQPAPLVLDLEDAAAMAGVLELLAAGRALTEPAH
ncbi:MAG TPA: hypothetical protein VIJ94_15085 [Caulobacteraceae bacterium]